MEKLLYFRPRNTAPNFWKRTAKVEKSSLTLDGVSGTLTKRFPFLNLKGLSEITLMIKPSSLYSDPFDKGRHCQFYVDSTFHGQRSGRLLFMENRSTRTLECNSLHPNLPQMVKGAGVTLFSLVLLRGNSFAEENINLVSLNINSWNMTQKIGIFEPTIVSSGKKTIGDALIKVPKLTEPELTAVEWYWEHVIKVVQ